MTAPRLALGTCALGRALDADGSPLDGGPALRGRMVALQLRSPRPDERVPIATPFWTGVRVIDGLLTVGRGARIGIFGAPGSGKSTLLESVVEGCAADAAVVALVGERGREANDWIGRRNDRTTIVCATSDRPAEVRLRAAHVAFAHAAALRERGLHVLLLLDSLARVASALREIAVARGESAGRGGFPPSVFADMARLVEVAGALADGSITLIATVIHDGDDRDPVSEAARALLDGHVVLALRLAEADAFRQSTFRRARAGRWIASLHRSTGTPRCASGARSLFLSAWTMRGRSELSLRGAMPPWLSQVNIASKRSYVKAAVLRQTMQRSTNSRRSRDRWQQIGNPAMRARSRVVAMIVR